MSKTCDVWTDLPAGEGKRINADGKFDFFWAILEGKCPALVLFLPAGIEEAANLPKLSHIEVAFRDLSSRAFVLRLLDDAQRELFLTLCLNVVNAAEGADTLESALSRAIHRTRRWHFFLKGGNSKGLTIEQQRGLVGELALLNELSDAIGPAAAIEAWKGPEGSSKDFEFPHCCIEVKARRGAAKPYVRISSEDQLSDVEGGKLFLRVYNVDSVVLPDGDNLHGHVIRTSKKFEDSSQIYEQWEDLIAATGYTSEDDYADRRWVVGIARTYQVVSGFPRIVSPLTDGVRDLTYSIALDSCAPFMSENDLTAMIEKGNPDG